MSASQNQHQAKPRGCIAIDKFGCEVLFIDPQAGVVEEALSGFPRTVHELLVSPQTSRAYVPIFGEGIHGNNPNPGNQIFVIDLIQRRVLTSIDLSPFTSPHTMRFGPDGLIYVTCENSGVVGIVDPATNSVVGSIEAGSTNCHRLEISPDGTRIYTENEEDCSVSIIDLPSRKLLGQIPTANPLGGLAVSADSKTVVAVDDEAPAIFLIDAALGEVRHTIALAGLEKPAQIARYAPDFSMLALTSMAGNCAILMDPDFTNQTIVETGHKPMDMAFHHGELFIACQGDGLIHVVDLEKRRPSRSFPAGVGCETLAFF